MLYCDVSPIAFARFRKQRLEDKFGKLQFDQSWHNLIKNPTSKTLNPSRLSMPCNGCQFTFVIKSEIKRLDIRYRQTSNIRINLVGIFLDIYVTDSFVGITRGDVVSSSWCTCVICHLFLFTHIKHCKHLWNNGNTSSIFLRMTKCVQLIVLLNIDLSTENLEKVYANQGHSPWWDRLCFKTILISQISDILHF